MGLLLGFVIGRIQIVHAAFETRVHNRQVLVGKRHVDDDIRPESPHQRRQLLDAVGIHPGRFNPSSAHLGGYVVGLALVRLANMISVNTGLAATLCATTVPTPPAPIISTLLIAKLFN